MTTIIVAIFIVGYAGIALEHGLKINKAATALLMCVLCWVFYMCDAAAFIESFHNVRIAPDELPAWINEHILLEHLGDTCETLFFLMGAMTIVEVVDANGGFNFVRESLATTSKRALLWRIAFMTFFLSAILDNLTTSIVMIMVLRKLVSDKRDRMIYAGLVILSANSGGAFSPIGDVTTIMLWIKGSLTTIGVITEIFLPSLVSMAVPAFILQYSLSGKLATQPAEAGNAGEHSSQLSALERKIVFWLGVGGLCFVPIFRFLTDLPPFMGILLVLGLLWAVTEIFFRHHDEEEDASTHRVTNLLSRIDLSTILFFLGILMAVATLQEIGVLQAFGQWLNTASGGNHYLVTGVIGVISSIVDNVPLVAGCMGMYPIAPTGDMAVDGLFWQLLAYCAGVGGSILIIGSAAGVIVMGLEKITFGWYLKHISWVALIGYLCGMLTYYIQNLIF
ncbi:MAG: sodium:proton antiporter NhaD [Prevotellaceae bacterium]|nr:sodium:proton antiporter NhaD [Prevotellaceae bacterium]